MNRTVSVGRDLDNRSVFDTVSVNQCDFGHETTDEVRRLPTGEQSGAIVCYPHYCGEMFWRQDRNKDLGDFAKFDLPAWESLAIYEEAIQ